MDNPKKNVSLIAIGVVVLAIAGYRLFATSGDPLALPEKFLGYGVCLACGQENQMYQAPGSSAPFVCPSCNERAMYKWLFCLECNTRFIPPLVEMEPGEPPRPAPFPTCPECGCPNITSYLEGFHKPAGDAELPAWPPN